jgi:hypothetical protein
MYSSSRGQSPKSTRKKRDSSVARQTHRMPWFNNTNSTSRSDFMTASGGTIGGGILTGRPIDTYVAIAVDRMATPNIGTPKVERLVTTPKNLDAIFGAFSQDKTPTMFKKRRRFFILVHSMTTKKSLGAERKNNFTQYKRRETIPQYPLKRMKTTRRTTMRSTLRLILMSTTTTQRAPTTTRKTTQMTVQTAEPASSVNKPMKTTAAMSPTQT